MVPLRLFLVRHGESEGNVTQDLSPEDPRWQKVKDVPDKALRLTPQGVEQAKTAGAWLREYLDTLIPKPMLSGFVSPFARAMETAGHLGLAIENWRQYAFIVERDWGKFVDVSPEEQRQIKQRKKIDPLFCTMPNGQNLSTLLISNYLFLGKLHRELSKQTVVAVCHGERIMTLRFMLEGMSDLSFGELIRSRHLGDRVRNTQIVEYSRINPHSGEETTRYEWMRSLCPWDVREKDLSWKAIKRERFTNESLLAYAEQYPRYLD